MGAGKAAPDRLPGVLGDGRRPRWLGRGLADRPGALGRLAARSPATASPRAASGARAAPASIGAPDGGTAARPDALSTRTAQNARATARRPLARRAKRSSRTRHYGALGR